MQSPLCRGLTTYLLNNSIIAFTEQHQPYPPSKMMYMRLFLLAIAASLLCLSRGQEAADTNVTEIVEPKISYLLEGVLMSDTVMVVKAIADGEDIDVVNVNGW